MDATTAATARDGNKQNSCIVYGKDEVKRREEEKTGKNYKRCSINHNFYFSTSIQLFLFPSSTHSTCAFYFTIYINKNNQGESECAEDEWWKILPAYRLTVWLESYGKKKVHASTGKSYKIYYRLDNGMPRSREQIAVN